MLPAFLIWSVVAIVLIVIAVCSRKSEKPAGFWANAKAPKAGEVTDVKAYNRAVSNLFITFALLYEAAGLPILFAGQNSPLVIVTILLTFWLVIGIMVRYMFIEKKFRKR